jgi:hypothetical protein
MPGQAPGQPGGPPPAGGPGPFPGMGHMSLVFSIDTADTSVSDAVLAFIQGIH